MTAVGETFILAPRGQRGPGLSVTIVRGRAAGSGLGRCFRAAAIAACVMPGAMAAADTRTCAVSQVEGEAYLIASGERIGAEVGGTVSERVAFETGAEGRLEIRCSDGLVVTIGPESAVEAEGLLAATDQSESVFLRLVRGITGIVAPDRTWDRFEVETDLAIASVRSTDWLVAHDAETGSAVFVAGGVVEVSADGASETLSEGQGIDVVAGAGLGEIAEWGTERVVEARAALGFDWASATGQ